MHDTRFDSNLLFKKRNEEWNDSKIEEYVTNIFKNLNMLETFQFNKIEWVKEKSKRTEELRKSSIKHLKVYVNEYTKKGDLKKEHIYNIQVPKLINGQFFKIGGLCKIPVFQLSDDPIIYKYTKNGLFLKFKNNVLSTVVNKTNQNKLTINIFNNNMNIHKKMPLEYLTCGLLEPADFETSLNEILPLYTKYKSISDLVKTPSEDIKNVGLLCVKNLYTDCVEIWNNKTKEDIYSMIGNFRVSPTNYDKVKKGMSVVFSVRIAPSVDIFTKQFMNYDCIIMELIKALAEGPRDDTHLDRKRLRFAEYIFSDLSKTVYDMICALKYATKIKFKITQSILTDACNVSEIVHFNTPNNPIDEISSIIQCSLTGPGGFKKKNVPAHLKNIDDSHFGFICPADTPDRDGCGVVLNIAPGSEIGHNGKFVKKSNLPCSYPITLTPFMKNDDQSRLQMAAGHQKQALLLTSPEKASIKTGSENKYLEHTSFLNIAPDNGKVLYKDAKFLIIHYDNLDKIETYEYGPRFSSDILDCCVADGKKIKKGDVLIKSKFIQENEVVLGTDLLTAIGIWKGFNYEDGIVISESVKDKMTSNHNIELSFEIESGQVLLSLLNNEYKPLPKIGECIKRGDVFAKIKHINGEEGYESINTDSINLFSPEDCVITNIELFSNTWNKQIPEFDNYVNNFHELQTNRCVSIKNELIKFMKPIDADRYMYENGISEINSASNVGSYKVKGNNISGIYVKIEASYSERIGVGDKIANRHGSKGVVSTIIPDAEMPTLADGRKVEIILNPLGIISRMNSGQLFELHVNEALFKLKNILRSKRSLEREVEFLEKFLLLTDDTDDKWPTKLTMKKFNKEYETLGKDIAIDNIQIIQPAFKSISTDNLFKLMNMVSANFKQSVFDNSSGKNINNELATGYMHFVKLVHRATDKMSARSLGSYNKNTLQPLGGKRNRGGHRLGELEVWSFLAHSANNVLEELLTTHSDSPGKKNEMLAEILQTPETNAMEGQDYKPQSYRMLESYLTVLGLQITD